MTYAEFWPRYLAAHRDPCTKPLHFIGTSPAIALPIAAPLA